MEETPLLKRIFPERFDNRYRGHKIVLWLLWPITLLNAAIALGAIFNPDGGAQSADGIPLNTFGAAGAEAVIHVVALLGLACLLLYLLFVLALLRYRAMVPLLYLLVVVDYLAHKAIGVMKPVAHVGGATASVVDLVLIGVSAAGLILSLSGKGYARGERATGVVNERGV